MVHTSYLIWKSSVWPFYLFRPGSASSCNYFYVKIVFCNNDFKPFAFLEGPVTLTILLKLLYKKQKWDISTKFRRNIHWFEWHQSQRMSLIVWLSAQRPRPPACLWGASNRVLQCARLKKTMILNHWSYKDTLGVSNNRPTPPKKKETKRQKQFSLVCTRKFTEVNNDLRWRTWCQQWGSC